MWPNNTHIYKYLYLYLTLAKEMANIRKCSLFHFLYKKKALRTHFMAQKYYYNINALRDKEREQLSMSRQNMREQQQ